MSVTSTFRPSMLKMIIFTVTAEKIKVIRILWVDSDIVLKNNFKNICLYICTEQQNNIYAVCEVR